MNQPISGIEKLCGTNYQSWAIQMKSVLIQLDYWDYVNGATKREDEKWVTGDSKALATIILGLKPTELLHVKYCLTSKEAWDKLYDVYNPSGPARKVSLLKQLVRFKFQSSQNLPDQILNFFRLVDNLKEIQLNIPEELLSVFFLNSLPDNFESFIVAIESRDTLPGLDQLKIKVLEECGRVEDRNETGLQPSEGVLAIKHKRTPNARGAKENKGKCFGCGKHGHYVAECRSKPKNKKSNFAESSLNSSNTKTSGVFGAVANVSGDLLDEEEWYLDSGATTHMCRSLNAFTPVCRSLSQRVTIANGETVQAHGIGEVELETDCATITLKNVLYVPSIKANFLSVSKIIEAGCTVQFRRNYAVVKRDDGQVLLRANQRGNIFVAELLNTNTQGLMALEGAGSGNPSFNVWHRRFGHLNARSLNQLKNQDMVKGMDLGKTPNSKCVTCIKGKIANKPFQSHATRMSEGILDLIHTDVCGPMRTRSYGGAQYFVTFVDDFSRKVYVRFLKGKNEVFEAFKHFRAMVENQTGRRIKCIRSDNGREYTNTAFSNFLAENGIRRQLTVPHTPQQNGVAERFNRTLVDMARCLLIDSKLPEGLWAEAINTAAYIRNRAPSKILQDKTPQEIWCGRKPSVKHLRVFGCKAIALKKGGNRSKFSPRGDELILVGYSEEAKGYRLFDTTRRTTIVSRDVEFLEEDHGQNKESEDRQGISVDWLTRSEDPQSKKNPALEVDCPKEDIFKETTESSEQTALDNEFESNSESDQDALEEPEELSSEIAPSDNDCSKKERECGAGRRRGRPAIVRTGKPGRPRKVHGPAGNFGLETAAHQEYGNPTTVAEAMSHPKAKEWMQAMSSEHHALMEAGTWTLEDLPRGQRAIGSKWVFTTKKDAAGNVMKHKARLVAQGFAQQYGVNYFGTSAPVIRASTIRFVFALAAEMELLVHHVDVVAAYLHAELKETVFMKQPEGFVDPANPNKVCKLLKSIYGLKQSGKVWNKKLNDVLCVIGFRRCLSDDCLYVYKNDQGLAIIAVYVDDIILASSSEEIMQRVKTDIGARLKIQDRGPVEHYLGMRIRRDTVRGSISLDQERYIEDVLLEFGMKDCKIKKTPLDRGMIFRRCADEGCGGVNEESYRSLIGSLNYIATWTRPDIACAVSKLAQFCNHPHREHWEAGKDILRYLKGTSSFQIRYEKTTLELTCYADADWGGDLDDRKSYSGYSTHLANGPISWSSRKQNTVCLSSTEAEYTAISEATREILYIRNVATEVGIEKLTRTPTTIRNDNQSAQHAIRNENLSGRIKHVDIKIHFVRDAMRKGSITLQFVESEEMIADILTKILPYNKHVFCVEGLGLRQTKP